MNCICNDSKCTHHRPMFGHGCREEFQQAVGSEDLMVSHLCRHCHDAHNTTVMYHTPDWDVLVSCGWVTVSVDPDTAIATMIKVA